ncbi:MAG: Hypothetical protein BHV28_06750 [Candidatus Tokpelaia hoelldobleri]|uniref:DUF218 domain-containing protein n=1 Tax=Candidatus Tokpelaia hoelldobleri TaxID=1902579 RepID=A0A1U9JU44_9HYPH|nr:MAG: Hypothetical protein BHV28_06750 [Candidatus Tokpelaia hoelldoblerii]
MRRFLIAGLIVLAVISLAMLVLALSGLREHEGRADIGVVPGASINSDGTPRPYLKVRLDKAVQAYRQGRFPRIMVSGGKGVKGRTEADVMAAYLIKHGVPAGRIIKDSAAYNTAATAENLKKYMDRRKLKSAFAITQFFHMPRMRLALSCAGVKTVYSSSAWFLWFPDLYSIFREVPAYAYYWWKC